jgi:DNA-binding NarL/FixJ family response regulator
MIRKALRRYLLQFGYSNIIEAEDASVAVTMARDHKPDFLCLDVVMGQMNGDLALAKIRADGSKVPVVMLSSITDQVLIKRCEGEGISGFIFKPINADTGAEVIKQYLKIA